MKGINTSGNVIKVLGDGIEREVVYRGSETLYPGCIVVPYAGTIAPTGAFDGSTGVVAAPTSPIGRMSIAVVNTTSANGRTLLAEYNDGDQIPVWYPEKGAKARACIATTASATKGNLLAAVKDGSGMVEVTADPASAIGIATEDMPTGDAGLPTLIEMEVF